MIRGGSARQLDLPIEPEARSAETAAQETMAFVLRMRERRISDVAVLRALETVPRRKFVPHRYLDLTLRDVALPIGCGQTMPEPWLVARMMEALALSKEHRVLEIGTGSGYATAILARLVAEVVSIERFQSLAIESAARLARLGVRNACVLHGDGVYPPTSLGLFDRILIHGRLDAIPDPVLALLAAGGVIVLARGRETGNTALMRISHSDKLGFQQVEICPCRASPLIGGVASAT